MRLSDARELAKLCWPTFVVTDDAVFLREALSPAGPRWEQFPDRTAAEAYYNHLHLLDLFDHGASLDGSDSDLGFWDRGHPDYVSACELGVVVAAMWRSKLTADFPGRCFRIYFCSDDNPVVRFHTVRPGEAVWLDERDWDGAIRAGRIVVLETPSDSL